MWLETKATFARSRLVSKENKTKRRTEDEHRKLYIAAVMLGNWKTVLVINVYGLHTIFFTNKRSNVGG